MITRLAFVAALYWHAFNATLWCCPRHAVQAFSPVPKHNRNNIRRLHSTALSAATTVEAPTKTERQTDQRTGTSNDDGATDEDQYDDLEYLIDSAESRELDDPFHILMLGSTFEKPKITVHYVSGALEYVLNMPHDEAVELSTFCKDEGLACLGTWSREECLSLGKQLQQRDLVCRVVPYVEGGQRGWQAKDAGASAGAGASSNSGDAFR